MPASLLGKRYRVADSVRGNDAPSAPSRVTRRARIAIHHDEEEIEPEGSSISRTQALETRNGESRDLREGDDDGEERSIKRVRTAGRPATTGPRIPFSPRRDNGQAVLSDKQRKAPVVISNFSTKATVTEEDEENVIQFPTPKTPRHRDALSKKVPVTPRHRIGLVGKPSTPRWSLTPAATPDKATSVYKNARLLFTRSGDTGRLVGRIQERTELTSFIHKCVEAKSGNSLYVSGPPGTGKSALVGEVCQDMGETAGVKFCYVNCMSVKGAGDLYNKLADALLDDEDLSEDQAKIKLQKLLTAKKTNSMYVVTLDEMDHLLGVNPDILYTLFEWSLGRSSRLVLIGIANALDLTDRFLPLLKAKNLKPQLLPFLPYTAGQIAEVVTSKLRSLISEDVSKDLNTIPFFQPAAIQLCSKKVASQTGDLRKAFDIIRRSLDLVELEKKQKFQQDAKSTLLNQSPSKSPLAENPKLSSASNGQLSSPTIPTLPLTALTAPRVSIAHVSRVSAAALSNGTTQRLQTLHLQQKAALCALISHQKKALGISSSIFPTPTKKPTTTSPTVRRLHETYSGLCKRENSLHPLSVTEFADVISGLETLGLIGEDQGGRAGFASKVTISSSSTPSRKRKAMGAITGVAEDRRVVCFVSEKEIQGSLDGSGADILRGLLRGDD